LLVKLTPRNVNLGNGRFAMFNKERDILLQREAGPFHGVDFRQAHDDPLSSRIKRGFERAYDLVRDTVLNKWEDR
jgi:hypothetical protein